MQLAGSQGPAFRRSLALVLLLPKCTMNHRTRQLIAVIREPIHAFTDETTQPFDLAFRAHERATQVVPVFETLRDVVDGVKPDYRDERTASEHFDFGGES